MKKAISSLLTAGLCTSIVMTNPLTVNGEQSTQSFEPTVGISNILTPELSEEEQKELIELAVRMLTYNKYKNYSLDNARERMMLDYEEPELEETEETEENTGYENRWGISELTDRELELLADIVWLEAGNQGLEGQELVAVTILNRVLSDSFDDNVIDVLSEPGQFSTWKYTDRANPTEETYEAINCVLAGQANENIENAQFKYFNNAPSFGNDYTKVGGHYFYN